MWQDEQRQIMRQREEFVWNDFKILKRGNQESMGEWSWTERGCSVITVTGQWESRGVNKGSGWGRVQWPTESPLQAWKVRVGRFWTPSKKKCKKNPKNNTAQHNTGVVPSKAVLCILYMHKSVPGTSTPVTRYFNPKGTIYVQLPSWTYRDIVLHHRDQSLKERHEFKGSSDKAMWTSAAPHHMASLLVTQMQSVACLGKHVSWLYFWCQGILLHWGSDRAL